VDEVVSFGRQVGPLDRPAEAEELTRLGATAGAAMIDLGAPI